MHGAGGGGGGSALIATHQKGSESSVPLFSHKMACVWFGVCGLKVKKEG